MKDVRAKVVGQNPTTPITVSEDRIDTVAGMLKDKLYGRTPINTGKARAGWMTREFGNGNKWVANGVDYVQYLNEGTSKQAPAGYIEATVDEVRSQVKGQQGKLIHSSRNGKPGWKYGEDGFVYTYDPRKPVTERKAKQKAIRAGRSAKKVNS